MKDLTFKKLREKNKKRLEKIHPKSLEWSTSDWILALTGELGELCGDIKKVLRGNTTWEEVKENAGKELADIMIYLDCVAYNLGIDLDKVVIQKFNEVSDKFGSKIKL